MHKTPAWIGLLGSYLFLALWALVVIYSIIDGPDAMFGMAFIGFMIWGLPGLVGVWLSRGATTYPLVAGLALLLFTPVAAFSPIILIYAKQVPLGLAGLLASSLYLIGAGQALWSAWSIRQRQVVVNRI